jgi:hypothetical protein
MPNLDRGAGSREDLRFYREQSELSSPGKYTSLFDNLPTDVHELCRVIQGLMLHQFWILDETNYGLSAQSLKDAGRDLNGEINLRSVEQILDFLIQMDDRSLTTPRPLESRVIGNCRDYSLLLTAMLRHRGIPARVRSGVARYFFPIEGHLEDHFICEFWNQADRWQQSDAQIDDLQRSVLNVSMDMADLPPDQFLNAGEAYAELTEGRVEPDKIGIFDFVGERYVRYKLISDLACVSGVEVLAWEGWGICQAIDTNALSGEELALLEEIAGMLVTLDPSQHQRARTLFESHPQLRIPDDYTPYYWELPDFK